MQVMARNVHQLI